MTRATGTRRRDSAADRVSRVAPAEEAHSVATDAPASPSARRFAREIGVALERVPDAGPSGRASAIRSPFEDSWSLVLDPPPRA